MTQPTKRMDKHVKIGTLLHLKVSNETLRDDFNYIKDKFALERTSDTLRMIITSTATRHRELEPSALEKRIVAIEDKFERVKDLVEKIAASLPDN